MKLCNVIFLSSLLLTAVLVVVLTAICHPLYMQLAADLNVFQWGTDYFKHMAWQPGGLLAWAGSLLQTTFAYPWLGTVIIIILVVLAGWCVCLLMKRCSPMAAAVALLMVLNFTELGYMLYVLKSPAPAITPTLGTIAAVGIGILYGKQSKRWWRAAMLCIVAVCYGLLGCFALLAIVLCVASRWREWQMALLGLVLILIVPSAYDAFFNVSIPSSQVYLWPLPDLRWEGEEKWLWLPFIAEVVLLILLTAQSREQAGRGHKSLIVESFIFCMVGVWTIVGTYNDSNFNQILRMAKAVEAEDWQTVLQTARATDVEPTRAEVLFRNLALSKTKRAAYEMFSYPDGDADYRSPRAASYLRLICARPLYFHYGKVNYSYRWAMEDMVEYGQRPAYLRYLYRCALVNDEITLANRYRQALEKIPFQPLPFTDDDKANLQPLMGYNNLLDGDNGLIETYLLNSFSHTEGGSRELTNLSLQCVLIQKDINAFWPRFIRLLPTFGTNIPRHYQEAVLLFAALQPQYDIRALPIDPTISHRFDALREAASAESQMGDEYSAQHLRPAFGDTYWYYYFFVKGLKTN